MPLTQARCRVAKFRSAATNASAFRIVAAPSLPLQWALKLVVTMLLVLYFLSSASILVYWNDMTGKADGKASITARVEFRASTLRFEGMWRARHPSIGPFQDETHDTASATAADRTELDSAEATPEAKYPNAVWKKNEFQCLGWVETNVDGDEVGRRECWQRVRGGESGFCEVLNVTSGELFRVMRTTSLSLKDDVRFTCQLAKEFTSYRHLAAKYSHDPPMALADHGATIADGIVMAVYEDVLPSAYASIHLLRAKGSRLPIELWFRQDELRCDNPVLQALVDEFGPVSLRLIHDERIEGFYVKAHALYYSHFDRVLLLDADNFALQDPAPLFSAEPFKRFGAVFWPDFWHPGNTIFNVHAQSLLWELLNLDYVDMFEQESGQVLVDRHASRPMLEMVMFFATHKPNLLKKLQLVWGDKDLFRLAWMASQQEFVFVNKRMPGSLGVINAERQRFCGTSMVQYDTSGREILFLHRNTLKLTGDRDREIWHTLQEYPLQNQYAPRSLPLVRSFSGSRLFNETSCFGVKRFESARGVSMRRVDAIPSLAGVESTLIKFATHARALLRSGASDSVAAP